MTNETVIKNVSLLGMKTSMDLLNEKERAMLDSNSLMILMKTK